MGHLNGAPLRLKLAGSTRSHEPPESSHCDVGVRQDYMSLRDPLQPLEISQRTSRLSTLRTSVGEQPALL